MRKLFVGQARIGILDLLEEFTQFSEAAWQMRRQSDDVAVIAGNAKFLRADQIVGDSAAAVQPWRPTPVCGLWVYSD